MVAVALLPSAWHWLRHVDDSIWQTAASYATADAIFAAGALLFLYICVQYGESRYTSCQKHASLYPELHHDKTALCSTCSQQPLQKDKARTAANHGSYACSVFDLLHLWVVSETSATASAMCGVLSEYWDPTSSVLMVHADALLPRNMQQLVLTYCLQRSGQTGPISWSLGGVRWSSADTPGVCSWLPGPGTRHYAHHTLCSHTVHPVGV